MAKTCWVSTHSRPKAAGTARCSRPIALISFNTQPPEGGWLRIFSTSLKFSSFQHTAARRRLGEQGHCHAAQKRFQHTAARRRLAKLAVLFRFWPRVSTHSRPKAAGKVVRCIGRNGMFQHTAARRRLDCCPRVAALHTGFNTQPPEGGWPMSHKGDTLVLDVSTHSRPKAAGHCLGRLPSRRYGFNTQPPEGGWTKRPASFCVTEFQHTAARRRLAGLFFRDSTVFCFNTQPPEGGWFTDLHKV